ncbi:MAG TPA: ABC transporter substrate-binding protein [Chloroflexi bacterium]|nr:MAG: ABC transporter substrate-binding protein [Chloroflexota bacterium]HDD55945.1 ABC transporter substrate-binding protein [Chloroflexota bacterium]
MKRTALLLSLLAISVVGCSQLPGIAPAAQTMEITDATGHTITLQENPENIAIAGKAMVMVQDAIYLFAEAPERVVALESRNQSAFAFLPVVDSGVHDKDIFETNVGPEQIAAAKPDLVILKNFMAESIGEPLEQLGIPVVYLDLETPEAFYLDIAVLGQVFGNSDRADEITDYYQTRVSRVEEMVSGAVDKPRVLLLRYNADGGEVAFSVPPASWLQTNLVETAGGVPIWADLEVGNGWTVVNLEQIAAWDPEQIFLVDYAGGASEIAAGLKDNPIWTKLGAVQKDQLFAFGYDFYSWDQPDTRWILGLQWLASRIHPDLTAELDILAEVNSFYKTLYFLDQETIDSEVLPILTGDLP